MKNPSVVYLSLMALVFMVLTFTVHWFFIIPAVAIVFINQRKLMKKRKSEKVNQ